MSTLIAESLMTLAGFMEMESQSVDGVHRELILGEVREYPALATRSAKNSEAIARISQALNNWLDDSPEDVPAIVGAGEARCRLRTELESMVGLDVALFQGIEFVERPREQSYFNGPPVVAVEILSATDTHEDISAKINLYISSGVRQVWIADPDHLTVTVHRPDSDPVMFSARQVLTAEPELPGFRCEVSALFGGRQRHRLLED